MKFGESVDLGADRADRAGDGDAVAEVFGVGDDLVPRAGGGDRVEGGGAVDLDLFGVDPDAEDAGLAPDDHGFGGAFDRDDDVEGACGGGRPRA